MKFGGEAPKLVYQPLALPMALPLFHFDLCDLTYQIKPCSGEGGNTCQKNDLITLLPLPSIKFQWFVYCISPVGDMIFFHQSVEMWALPWEEKYIWKIIMFTAKNDAF